MTTCRRTLTDVQTQCISDDECIGKVVPGKCQVPWCNDDNNGPCDAEDDTLCTDDSICTEADRCVDGGVRRNPG